MGEQAALVDRAERDRIRHDLDTTFIVEAAAGTGKTTELIGRMVEVLAAGRAEVEEIVAVTFTEKAAGELKLRLRTALEAERAAVPALPRRPAGRASHAARGTWNVARGTSPVKRRTSNVERALSYLEEAHVSTIHAFCAELLRERPVEARLDPRFQVLLEPEARQLFDEVFDLWLQRELERAPEGIRRAIRRSSRFAGDEEDDPTGRLRVAGWTLVEWRDFEAPWRRDPFARAAEIDRLVTQLFDLAALTEEPARRGDNLHYDTRMLRRVRDDVRAAERVRPRDYDGLEAQLVQLSRDRDVRSVRKGYGSSYREGVARADVLAAHAALVGALDRFARAADADLAALLRDELAGALQAYERAKREAGRVDFVDLLLGARDLLRDNATVRREFQRRFTRIFVDEFQDTDPLQAEILLLLAAREQAGGSRTPPEPADWRELPTVPGKLFIVGDPKQSIYRFRRADIAVYQEVKARLLERGAGCLQLATSFRSVPALQHMINEAFAPVMAGDPHALQPEYVRLAPFRSGEGAQPAVVALPVPRPYGKRRVSGQAIEASLPDAVGAFVGWLLEESGWTVTRRSSATGSGTAAGGPVQPSDVCILFRRFEKYRTDMTRPYVSALEARGIPHLIVGGRSFHRREEVETMRAALAAVEWPDDELSVFATLRGSLFAVSDEHLLEYRDRFARLHPFRIPGDDVRGPDAGHLDPIAGALALLASLHRRRNHVPVTETIGRLLDETRAHAGFVLRPSGEQALANVLQIAELARRHEASGGISFRGFVERLREEAEGAQAGEAPILEEGSEGVRLMTVHKAKGLEFPVVILADITANLTHQQASRYIDAARELCAVRIGGLSPADLLDHEDVELARDRAEGYRLAYVAATRARDLLVVPAVGDGPYDDKWMSVLNAAIYPSVQARRSPQPPPPGLTQGRDTVLERPDGDPARPETVASGVYHFTPAPSAQSPAANAQPPVPSYSVLWWLPEQLDLGRAPSFGIRHERLIGKEVERKVVEAGLKEYRDWRSAREAALAGGGRPSLVVQTVTERAAGALPERESQAATAVLVVEPARAAVRPAGPRFGALVHAVLAAVPLSADAERVAELSRLEGRVLGATDEEVSAASAAASAVLRHPLMDRARAAEMAGSCYREVPVAFVAGDGTLVEGTIDLLFREAGGWTLVDFKTDRELAEARERYERQVRLYGSGIGRLTGDAPVVPVLVQV